MGLLCGRPERCDWCPDRSPRVPVWWTITTRPWRLCASDYEDVTGEKP